MSRSLASTPRLAATAALLVTATACSDATGPGTTNVLPLDPSTVHARAAQVEAVTSQPIFAQLEGDGGDFAALRAGVSAQRLRVTPLLGTSARAEPAVIRGALEAAAPRAEFLPGEAVVPASMRGLTFAWSQGGWRVDSAAGRPRTGAPANGARFILKRLDSWGEPTSERLGHLDLVDLSSGGTTRYTTRVVTTGGLTVLESTTSVGGTYESPTMSQVAWVTDGTRRITQSFSFSDTRLSYAYDAPFARFSYALSAGFGSLDEVGEVQMTVAVDGTRVRITSVWDGEYRTQGKVYVNGRLFAHYESTVDAEPIFHGADGRTPLDDEDVATLAALGDATTAFLDTEWMDAVVSYWVEAIAYGY